MHDSNEGGPQAYLSRSELELHLARLALVVMRAAPEAFEDLGSPAPSAGPLQECPSDVAANLLRRARPEHRPFVEARLLELARCLAGTRAPVGTHDWLSATMQAPAAGGLSTRVPRADSSANPHLGSRRSA